jgi:putative tryptophan/tyrosine transport system substrate-binding protein
MTAMRPRTFVALILVLVAAAAAWYALSTLTAELPPLPQKSKPRILMVNNPPALSQVGEHFKMRMKELGYVEEERAEYIEIDVGTDVAATKNRIAEVFDAQKPDVIFSTGVIATRAAKEYVEESAPQTPVVFGVVSDPVGGGLVKSLRSSENMLTGITPASNVTASKRIELLKEILPSAERVVIAWNDDKTSGIANIRALASATGLEVAEKKVANVTEMESYYKAFAYRRGDAILRAADGVAAGALSATIQAGMDNKVPVIGTNSGDTRRGALMSFGADYTAARRHGLARHFACGHTDRGSIAL